MPPCHRDGGGAAGPCRAASRSGCRARRPGPPCPVRRGAGSALASCRPGRRDRSALARCPARRSSRFSHSSGIHSGCSMTARYMSAIQRAPSGPVLSMVGRNQLSLEARNSRPDSLGPRRPRKVTPSGSSTIRCTSVVDRLADEQARGEPGAEQFVAIGGRAVRRGGVVGRAGVVEPGERPADRDRARVSGSSVCFGSGAAIVRVASEVLVGQDEMPAPVRVIVAEPAAPVVAVPAVLGLAALGLELAGIRPETEVAAADPTSPCRSFASGPSRRYRRWPRRPSRRAPARSR